jgi:DNA-binding MarR family transcriptional regulator
MRISSSDGVRLDPPAVEGEDARADTVRVAATAIRRGATSFAARARAERGGVLTLNQTAVLGQLAKNGAMTPTEIADRLHSSLQSLTRTLAGLEEQRMLIRATDPGDRRQSMLSITTAGREELWREMQPRDRWLASVLENELTEVEIELLVVASKLLERLSEVDSAVAPIER